MLHNCYLATDRRVANILDLYKLKNVQLRTQIPAHPIFRASTDTRTPDLLAHRALEFRILNPASSSLKC